MENTEIINIWRSHDRKLEQNLVLNKIIAEEITRKKVKSALSSMTLVKLLAVMIGTLWVISLDFVIVNLIINALDQISPFFLVSACIQVLITKVAIGVYIHQLLLIHKTDISESITETQERLTTLTSSTLLVTRILFLQLPLWTTFYLHSGMLEAENTILLIFQAFVTISFSFLAIWLFKNIKYENKDKKWFRLLFSGAEWVPIIKSMELLKEVEEFKKS
jgi:hypothetical protein